MKKKVSLACSECGSRNYSTNVSNNHNQTRLNLKKFCRHCNEHTIHRETK